MTSGQVPRLSSRGEMEVRAAGVVRAQHDGQLQTMENDTHPNGQAERLQLTPILQAILSTSVFVHNYLCGLTIRFEPYNML